MGALKRFLASDAALALLRPLLKAYRPIFFGGVSVRHDRSLLAFLRTGEPALLEVWHQDLFWT